MLVFCVADTALDFGIAGVGVIFFFWRWLRCTKTHAFLSSEYIFNTGNNLSDTTFHAIVGHLLGVGIKLSDILRLSYTSSERNNNNSDMSHFEF